MATTGEQRGSGKRVAVLLLLWSALVVLLLAVGLVVLRSDAPTPVGDASGAVAEHASTAIGDASTDERQRVVADDGRPRASRWTGPTLPAQFQLRTAYGPGNGLTQYSGPCEVQDPDGASLATVLGVVWPRTVSCALPATLPRVRWVAPGHRPVERDVPPPVQGVFNLGEVVLEPDAAVEVRVAHLPEWFAGSILSVIVDGSGFNFTGTGTAALLLAPSGRALELTVRVSDKGLYACATVPQVRLQRGERRTCDIDLDAGPAFQLAVVGPSPALLPYLRLLYQSSTAQLQLQLDSQGRVTLRGMEYSEGQFLLDTDDTQCPLSAREPKGKVIELEPKQRLVGLRVIDGDGTLACELGFGATMSCARSMHVILADSVTAAATIHASTRTTGTLRWPVSAIRWHDDVGTLDVRDAEHGSDLTVVASGVTPIQRTQTRLFIEVTGTDGRVRREYDGPSFRFEDLEVGHYRVQWCFGRAPVSVITDDLEIVAGKQQKISTTWPAMSVWRGEIDNWDRVPLTERMASVGLGEFEGWALSLSRFPIDEAGHFELSLPDDQEPSPQVTFFLSTMWCAGRVLAVDAATHTVHVEHPTGQRWVEVRAQPQFGGEWSVMFKVPGSDFFWANMDRRFNRLLMPPGGTLRSMLCEGERVTAWGTIDGRQSPVTIAPTGGHWCDLRLERAGTSLSATVCGPDGPAGTGFAQSLNAPGTMRIWIADGTRSIQVDLTPGGRQVFDAAQTEIVIR